MNKRAEETGAFFKHYSSNERYEIYEKIGRSSEGQVESNSNYLSSKGNEKTGCGEGGGEEENEAHGMDFVAPPRMEYLLLKSMLMPISVSPEKLLWVKVEVGTADKLEEDLLQIGRVFQRLLRSGY